MPAPLQRTSKLIHKQYSLSDKWQRKLAENEIKHINSLKKKKVIGFHIQYRIQHELQKFSSMAPKLEEN